ncbi:MAG: hypothetical protein NTZ32_11090 [Planctomycetales bacterium]|nr:hypothetical protein [Planctomycetales bacterium]
MLKLISNVSRRGLVLGALALCLTTTTAWALNVNAQVPCFYPGVNAGGNLDGMLGTSGLININVNTNTGKFHASGKATVQNLSGERQTFTNVPFDIQNATVTSSRYSCSKKGVASLAGSGMALPPA